MSTSSASAVFSCYGWIFPFGTYLGGYLSDFVAKTYELRGRLFVLMISFCVQGVLFLVFGSIRSLSIATAVLVASAASAGIAVGSLFAIVKFVDSDSKGSVEGIVGSSMGVGGVAFGLGFRQLAYTPAFRLMGFTIIGAALLTLFVQIRGHPSILSSNPSVGTPNADGVQEKEQDSEGAASVSSRAFCQRPFMNTRVSFTDEIKEDVTTSSCSKVDVGQLGTISSCKISHDGDDKVEIVFSHISDDETRDDSSFGSEVEV